MFQSRVFDAQRPAVGTIRQESSASAHRVKPIFDGTGRPGNDRLSRSEYRLTGDDPPFQFQCANGVITPCALARRRVAARRTSASSATAVCNPLKIERASSAYAPYQTECDDLRIGHHADRYESDAERVRIACDIPDLTVGEGSVIERAILDRIAGRAQVRIVNRKARRRGTELCDPQKGCRRAARCIADGTVI